jgi:hypothetical protein
VDFNALFGGYGDDAKRRVTLEWTLEHSRLVFEEAYSPVAFAQYVHEQLLPLPDAIGFLGKYRNAKPAVSVYEMLLPAKGSRRHGM